jgi:flagellar biosynthesis/type III secretory pathway protein FliH
MQMSQLPAASADEVLPPQPTLHDVVAAVVVALSKLPGADDGMIGRAQAALEVQYQRGFRRGQERGRQDGYAIGYQEGIADGRREALDEQAREEAERATLKAAARARRDA